MKKVLILLAVPLLLGAGCNKMPAPEQTGENNDVAVQQPATEVTVTNFEECVAAGNPIMESHPRRCAHNDVTYTEILEEQDDEVNFDLSPYSHSGDLEDVTGGDATGVASALFTDMTVILHAEFKNLPPLEDDYFYEGWLVRKEPFDFISTGETVMGSDPGHHSNDYIAMQNFDGYDFYVLTLEPDDGDPAPAAHILEGTMTPNPDFIQ